MTEQTTVSASATHNPAATRFVQAAGIDFAHRRFGRSSGLPIFCQFEPAFGQLPGGGGAQHLTRLMGRSRALEVMLSAEDHDAELAER
jgi:hypothetical protein